MKSIVCLIALAASNSTFAYAKEFSPVIVDKNKEFIITFNKEVNRETVNKDTIKVIDSKGKEVNVTVNVKNNKIATVKPKDSYKEGETYTMIVNEGVKDSKNHKLSEKAFMKFTVKENKEEGATRVESVKYLDTTIKNNNAFQNKTYTALDRANVLDKSKILMSEMFETRGYDFIVDFEKSQDAFKKIDVLDSIFVRDDLDEEKILTINFGRDIDESSLIDRKTMIIVPVGFSSTNGFNYDLESGQIKVVSVDKETVKLKISRGVQPMDRARYLFLYGVKDTKGNVIRPTVIPIWFDDASGTRAKDLSNHAVGDYWFDYKDYMNEFKKVTGVYATGYNTSMYTLANWDSIKDGLNKYFSNNIDVIKEVRNRMYKYQIVYEDLYRDSIYPTKSPQNISNLLFVWDRFMVNGKQVEVLFYGDSATLEITIYDKGDSWNTNFNVIGDGYLAAYLNKDYPTLQWNYNFNEKYFKSLTYKK